MPLLFILRGGESAAPGGIGFQTQNLTELAAVDVEHDAVRARRRGASAGETGDTQGRRLFLGALAGRWLAFAFAALAHAAAEAAALRDEREVPGHAVQARLAAGAQLRHGFSFDVDDLQTDLFRRLGESVVELCPGWRSLTDEASIGAAAP